MCGIAGVLQLDGRPAEADGVRRMCAALAHRGPDDELVVLDGPMALGHRRLAIIDLSPAARQPMASDDGTAWITYNGEIYNFKELRTGYVARGCRFRSQSDTEVVLQAYAERGPECVTAFNGIFAFGLWDSRARRLVLARDRFGVKPLYYRVEPGRLIFASEIKAILAVMAEDPRVCMEAMNEYFTFQNVFSDLTLFEGIRILPPAHLLVVEDGRLALRPYWDLVFAPAEMDEAEAARRVREALKAAVVRQLVADVPIGATLSGGMDSASIVAVASRRIPRLATFTGGFDLSSVSGLELAFDERADAERVASAYGTEHYEMVMHAGDMAWVLPQLIWHLEDLRVGMCYQNFYIARLASRFVRVVLAGIGGDEIFAGYPWRYGPIADCDDEEAFEHRYYHTWCRLVPDDRRREFFTSDVLRQIDVDAPRESFRSVLRPTKGWPALDKALYFDSKTFLHGLLVVEDRVAMAHAVETRVPLLDQGMIDVAGTIPARYKIAGSTSKAIFRRALADLLPEAVVSKPKQGFSPPDQSWYRGPTMGYIREILLSKRSLERGFVNPDYVRRVVEDHVVGRVNYRLLLWSLLSFEWWCRCFLDKERPV